jgi:hypothetical protein
MILQLLAGAPVAGRRCGATGQHDEAVLARGAGTDNDQRVMPHVGARARHTVGEQNKWIDRAELCLRDAHRQVVVSGQRLREFRPVRANGASVRVQRRRDVEAHAVNMDM